jgi:hypothetical protein
MNRFLTLLFFVVLLFSFCKNSNAQFYLSPKYTGPTGYLKDYVNSGYGIELGVSSKFYFGVRSRNFLNIDFLNNPDKKAFQEVFSGGSWTNTELTSLRYYISANYGLGLDFEPVKFDKFSLYYGLDFLFGFNTSQMDKYRFYIDGSTDFSSYYFSSLNSGLRPKLGLEYPLKFGSVGIEFTRSYVVAINYKVPLEGKGKLASFHGKYSLGLFYKF